MPTRTLVLQAESSKPASTGHYFGYEVFDVDGSYVLVIHTSLYDGMKRTSHWACPEQPMEALTREGASDEAAKRTSAYARAVLGLEERS